MAKNQLRQILSVAVLEACAEWDWPERQRRLSSAFADVYAGSVAQRQDYSKPDLVVLPETFGSAYDLEQFDTDSEPVFAPPSGSDTPVDPDPLVSETSCSRSRFLSQQAKKHAVFVVGGIIERVEDRSGRKLYNTILVYGRDGVLVTKYRKIHLSNVKIRNTDNPMDEDDTAEDTVLTPGAELASFQVDIGDDIGGDEQNENTVNIGLQNCFDLRFPKAAHEYRHSAAHDCHVLLYPSYFLHSTVRLGHWEVLLKARALDNQVFTVGANQRFENTASAEKAGFLKSVSGKNLVLPGGQSMVFDILG
ncbi:MAG: hypothetical protein MK110_07585, partial [Fuerstiella sp.]|nr:hypothetical protein [Fuerstiella sp.]